MAGKLGRFLFLPIDGRVSKTYADSLIHLNILNPEEEKLGRFLFPTDRWQNVQYLSRSEDEKLRFLFLPVDGRMRAVIAIPYVFDRNFVITAAAKKGQCFGSA